MSGSAWSAAVEIGDVVDFFARGVRMGVAFGASFEGSGSFGDDWRAFEVFGAAAAVVASAGVLRGVLNGERNGFERVCEASMRRRLAAGVDILAMLVLEVSCLSSVCAVLADCLLDPELEDANAVGIESHKCRR